MNLNKFFLHICLVLGIIFTGAYAKESDKNAAVKIWADSFVADKKNNRAQYEGNVRFEQGSIKIQCDKLEIIYRNDKIVRFILSSQENTCQFEQLDDNDSLTTASAQEMVYEQKKEQLTFTGQAELKQGKNIFKAESMLFNTADNRLISNKADDTESKPSRVFISIEPDKS